MFKHSKLILRIFGRFILTLVALGLVSVTGLTLWALVLTSELPDIAAIQDLKLKVPLRIYSSDGLLIAEYGEERRVPVRIEDAPPLLIKAVLAAEDDRYYEHTGIDLQGIARAFLANIQAGSTVQGASTITMQVARNYFLSRERTYKRKATEALLALNIERHLTKDEILELYINKIFLGQRAYGFGAAAKAYYGKPLDELDLAQYAMLAALPKAPSSVNPLRNPEAARQRRDYVLGRMKNLDYIAAEEYRLALEQPLTAANRVAKVELVAPYVAEFVRQQIIDQYGESAYEDGYQIYTTVDSDSQIAARNSLRKGLVAYDRRHGYRGAVRSWDLDQLATEELKQAAISKVPRIANHVPMLVLDVQDEYATALTEDGETIDLHWEGMQWARPFVSPNRRGPEPKKPADVVTPGDIVYAVHNEDSWSLSQVPLVEGALVAIDVNDGAIRALQGGMDYFSNDGKFNRATQASRQLGSNIKPFIYSAAIDYGFTTADMVSAAPVVVEDDSSGIVWRPRNYSGRFFGELPLRQALSKSVNLVSVRLVREIGINETIDYLTRFGFDESAFPKGLSLALGSSQTTPLKVVSGYATFANGGYLIEPYIIDYIKDRFGKVIYQGRRTQVCPSCLEEPLLTNGSDNGQSDFTHSNIAPRVISSGNAYIMNNLLREVVQSGTARRAQALGRTDLAGKTGTTNNFEDAWFSGFNGSLAATVWVGFDAPDHLGQNESGARAALPIWIEFMETALEGVPEHDLLAPDNVITTIVNRNTGEPAAEGPDTIQEVFLFGTREVAQPSLPAVEVTADQNDSVQPPNEDIF